MFSNQHSPTGRGPNQGSSFYSSVSGLATTLAIAAAILAAPPLYGLTAEPLHAHLSNAYDEGWADLLTPLMGLVEAAVIFFSARALFSIAAIWITLAVISRGFAVA